MSAACVVYHGRVMGHLTSIYRIDRMETTERLITAEEFTKMPYDGCRLELIAGKVTRLTADDVLDGGEIVPGWNMPIAEIFS